MLYLIPFYQKNNLTYGPIIRGQVKIREEVPDDYRLSIECFGKNPNLIIDNENDEIVFSVPEIDPSPDVICIFNNIKKGSGGGGCTLASGSNNNSIVILLLIPTLTLIRRFVKKRGT